MSIWNLQVIETMLEGRISKNPRRFDSANGIVFEINREDDFYEEYFRAHGVELYHLNRNVFYTETVMSISEFDQLLYVENAYQVA